MPTASRSPEPDRSRRRPPTRRRSAPGGGESEHLIGLPMGRASGVCCIDVDTSEDHADGVAEWEKIAAQHEPIVTREHRSATGGPHLMFDFEQPIGCSTGDLPAGIEVKGEGSYIVVPPSLRKGRAYTVHQRYRSRPAAAVAARSDHRRADALVRRAVPRRGHRPTPESSPTRLPRSRTSNVSWDDWKAMGLRIYASLGTAGFEPVRPVVAESRASTTRRTRPRPGSRSKPRRRIAPAPARSSSGRASTAGRRGWWSARRPIPAADGDIDAARREIKDLIGAFWAKAEALSRAACRLDEEGARRADAAAAGRGDPASRPASARPSRRSRTSRPAAGRGWSTRSIGICWATRSRSASPRSGCRPRCFAAAARTIRTIRDSRCVSNRRGWRSR